MPDVLTHVLVGYAVGVLLAARFDRLDPPHVTAVMFGALSPDLAKASLVVPSGAVEATLGVPFSWFGLHLLGGTIVVALLAALLVAPGRRRLVFGLVLAGAATHHGLDLLLLNASGYAYPVLWPLSEYSPPAGMLYRSSDRWPALVAGTAALAVWLRFGRDAGGGDGATDARDGGDVTDGTGTGR